MINWRATIVFFAAVHAELALGMPDKFCKLLLANYGDLGEVPNVIGFEVPESEAASAADHASSDNSTWWDPSIRSSSASTMLTITSEEINKRVHRTLQFYSVDYPENYKSWDLYSRAVQTMSSRPSISCAEDPAISEFELWNLVLIGYEVRSVGERILEIRYNQDERLVYVLSVNDNLDGFKIMGRVYVESRGELADLLVLANDTQTIHDVLDEFLVNNGFRLSVSVGYGTGY